MGGRWRFKIFFRKSQNESHLNGWCLRKKHTNAYTRVTSRCYIAFSAHVLLYVCIIRTLRDTVVLTKTKCVSCIFTSFSISGHILAVWGVQCWFSWLTQRSMQSGRGGRDTRVTHGHSIPGRDKWLYSHKIIHFQQIHKVTVCKWVVP